MSISYEEQRSILDGYPSLKKKWLSVIIFSAAYLILAIIVLSANFSKSIAESSSFLVFFSKGIFPILLWASIIVGVYYLNRWPYYVFFIGVFLNLLVGNFIDLFLMSIFGNIYYQVYEGIKAVYENRDPSVNKGRRLIIALVIFILIGLLIGLLFYRSVIFK